MWTNFYMWMVLLFFVVGIPVAIISGLLQLAGKSKKQAENDSTMIYFALVMLLITILGSGK